MALTRFSDPRSGAVSGANPTDTRIDGPVSGALQILTAQFDAVTGTTTPRVDIDLPAGCRFRITDATFRAQTVTSNPDIQIGTIAAVSALVASVNATTRLGALTLKAAGKNYAQGDVIRVTITAGSGEALTMGVVTLIGHISAPPQSVSVRNSTYF